MSTTEEHIADEQKDWALFAAWDAGDAMECDGCGKLKFLSDLNEVGYKIYCEDCIIDLGDEPDEELD